MSGGDQTTTATTGDAVRTAGTITRLNPQDGLFLRADHLNLMQDYARDLAAALGVGVGPGVVYGFGLSLVSGQLVATPGLAVTASGTLMRTDVSMKLPLDATHLPTIDDVSYGLVVVRPGDDVLSGAEKAYGTVCADPCDGTATIRSRRQPSVDLRVLPRSQPELGSSVLPPDLRRNRLASLYFEAERTRSRPWIVPVGTGLGVPALRLNPWAEAGEAPDRSGEDVPLGVLLRVNGALVLDTWIARREVAGPPGAARWAGHLAMRAWPVFLAQVLQFQDQITRSASVALAAEATTALLDPRDDLLQTFRDQVDATKSLGRYAAVKTLMAELEQLVVAEGGPTLADLGFTELPPAGYLPVGGAREGRDQVERLFGDTATLHWCDVRADAVADAVQAAQHRDRIPLDPKLHPDVDILVPSLPADLPALRTQAYGWVAFARREACCCVTAPPPQTEDLEVALSNVDLDKTVNDLEGGTRPESTDVAKIGFPAGSDTPPSGYPLPAVLKGVTLDAVLAAGPDQSTVNLAAHRARNLLAAWKLESGDPRLVVQAAFTQAFVLLIRHFE